VIKSRREAIGSGVLSAVAGMIPALLLHLSFAARYPQILGQAIPAHWMIVDLAVPALTVTYLVVLFGSLLDTGLCFIQSVNERIDGWRAEVNRPALSRASRASVAIACVLASGGLSYFGVVDLVARGYGSMAWGFLLLYVGPLLSIGLYRLHRAGPER